MQLKSLCKQCANKETEKRKNEKKKKSRMAESLETNRVNLIKLYDQTPQQV